MANQGLGYRPELDGLRAIAIGIVMLFHSSPYMRVQVLGGFLGVDLFFVLSGFLITSLLVAEWDRGASIDFGRFFQRRALRLLPGLALLLIGAGLVVAWVGSNLADRSYLQSAILAATYIGNWFQTPQEGLGILTHTWSLAIEGQYYVAWPVMLVIGLRRDANLGRLAVVALVGAISVAAWRAFAFNVFGINAALYGTHVHVDGLLLGSALGLGMIAPRLRRVLANVPLAWLATAGAAVIVIVVSPQSASVYNGLLFAANLCFAVIVGHVAVSRDGVLGHVLRIRPLPAIGLISYGMYLYHLPINVVVHGFPPERVGTEYAVIAWVLTLVVAIASYVAVEKPALRFKRRRATPARDDAPAAEAAGS